MNAADMITMGIRLSKKQRASLGQLASQNYNTPSSIIRMAVDQLIAATEANGGHLPLSVEAARDLADQTETATAGARL